MSPLDPVEEGGAHGVLDVLLVPAGRDEELVLDVDVVLGLLDGLHHGVVDAGLDVVDAAAPVGSAAQHLIREQIVWSLLITENKSFFTWQLTVDILCDLSTGGTW